MLTFGFTQSLYACAIELEGMFGYNLLNNA